MSDDFGTVNVRGAERAREIEVLRQHYRRHRDALHRMIADAPTETLAKEYGRLADEIDRSIIKLDELEGRETAAPAVHPPQAAPPRAAVPAAAAAAAHAHAAEPAPPHGDPLRAASQPGMRTLQPGPGYDQDDTIDYGPAERQTDTRGGWRVVGILAAALVALLVLGWLIWRASSEGPGEVPLADTAPAATETVEPLDTAPRAEPVAALQVSPPSHDYGTVRKGTRATRRFEVTNQTEEPITIEVARSACRCLYYDYDALIPPRAKQGVTVTIDGAKAKAGALREPLAVTAKGQPEVATTLEVVAEIR